MKAYVAMSGGVDSAVAAYIMKKTEYKITGVTLKMHNDNMLSCGGDKDIQDAKAVCDKLGIPFKTFEYTDDFKRIIVEDFIDNYRKGFTPNPCIRCNRYMKFEKLIEEAEKENVEKIVTGHYAVIEEKDGRFLLKKGKDINKDQSYYLYSLTQHQLSKVMFPLGNFVKDEVRLIAKEQGFSNSDKKDSQDICFVPDKDYASFIEKYTGEKFEHGNFIDDKGNVLGVHKGIINYTIGQRKGLGVSSTAPLFVTKITPENNTVTLTHGEGLFSDTLIADNINLISVDHIDKEMKVKAKVRYRQKEQDAVVTQVDDDKIRIQFFEPQRAITKGQSVVMYDGDIVVGGGIII